MHVLFFLRIVFKRTREKAAEVWDPQTGQWSSPPPVLPPYEHVTWQSTLCPLPSGCFAVLGGQHPVSFLDKKLCRLFDPRAGWRELPDMNVARCGAGATTVAGGMLIVGGESLSDNRDSFDSGRGGGAVATPVRSSRHR